MMHQYNILNAFVPIFEKMGTQKLLEMPKLLTGEEGRIGILSTIGVRDYKISEEDKKSLVLLFQLYDKLYNRFNVSVTKYTGSDINVEKLYVNATNKTLGTWINEKIVFVSSMSMKPEHKAFKTTVTDVMSGGTDGNAVNVDMIYKNYVRFHLDVAVGRYRTHYGEIERRINMQFNDMLSSTYIDQKKKSDVVMQTMSITNCVGSMFDGMTNLGKIVSSVSSDIQGGVTPLNILGLTPDDNTITFGLKITDGESNENAQPTAPTTTDNTITFGLKITDGEITQSVPTTSAQQPVSKDVILGLKVIPSDKNGNGVTNNTQTLEIEINLAEIINNAQGSNSDDNNDDDVNNDNNDNDNVDIKNTDVTSNLDVQITLVPDSEDK
jgi:hypothetical protein